MWHSGNAQGTRSALSASENHIHEEMEIMTVKFFRWPAALLGVALAFSAGAGVSRAQYGGGGARPTGGAAQEQNPEKSKEPEKKEKVNKAEEAAYKNVLAAQGGDPAAQIQVGEEFVSKFPTSRYVGGVYGMLTNAYYATGNTDKMFEIGDKALAANPDNVDVLALLAMAIPRRVKATTPDGAQRLAKAEGYAHHAIELIPNMTKPDTVDDATFAKAKNDKLSLAHSGLGLIDIDHQKYDDAKTELTQAVQLSSSPDPVDYFLLGNADVQGSYYKDAVDAYEKCSASGPLVAQCKARAESAKHDAETKLGR
jgi:tetratricopeptide (TPR) repeat protein